MGLSEPTVRMRTLVNQVQKQEWLGPTCRLGTLPIYMLLAVSSVPSLLSFICYIYDPSIVQSPNCHALRHICGSYCVYARQNFTLFLLTAISIAEHSHPPRIVTAPAFLRVPGSHTLAHVRPRSRTPALSGALKLALLYAKCQPYDWVSALVLHSRRHCLLLASHHQLSQTPPSRAPSSQTHSRLPYHWSSPHLTDSHRTPELAT